MYLTESLLTKNSCYLQHKYIYVSGIMIHSTGANNKKIDRYVKAWNQTGIEKCVHAFVGVTPNGKIGTVQTLPWNMKGWHCGKGLKGSANNTHIGIEVCEDDLTDAGYFSLVIQEVAEITASLCKQFSLDPLKDGVIISHSEGHKRGVASNHGDIDHWLKRFGMTMNDFREKVYNIGVGKETNTMTQEQFESMAEKWQNNRAKRTASEWASEKIKDAVIAKITYSEKGAQKFVTKEECIAMILAAFENLN